MPKRPAVLIAAALSVLAVVLARTLTPTHTGIPAKGPPVPGTSATVSGKTFAPLHVGEVLGTLPKVNGGCYARDPVGTEQTNVSYDIAIAFDPDCRVYVKSINPVTAEEATARPSGGVFVAPSPAPSR